MKPRPKSRAPVAEAAAPPSAAPVETAAEALARVTRLLSAQRETFHQPARGEKGVWLERVPFSVPLGLEFQWRVTPDLRVNGHRFIAMLVLRCRGILSNSSACLFDDDEAELLIRESIARLVVSLEHLRAYHAAWEAKLGSVWKADDQLSMRVEAWLPVDAEQLVAERAAKARVRQQLAMEAR